MTASAGAALTGERRELLRPARRDPDEIGVVRDIGNDFRSRRRELRIERAF